MKNKSRLLICCIIYMIMLVFVWAPEAKAAHPTTRGIEVGIEQPVPGEHPNFSPELTVITDYDGYTGPTTNSAWIDKTSSSPITGGIQWYDEDLNKELSSTDVFVLGHSYRLAMAIEFTFDTTKNMSAFSSQLAFPSSGGFYCIGYKDNGYGYKHGVYFFYSFEPATLPVPAIPLAITVDPPVPGSSPSLSINYPSNTYYTNNPVSWYDLTYNRAMSTADTFEYGHDYRLSFSLIPEEWYYFTADNATSSATINGVAVDEFSFINKSEIQVNHVLAAPRLVTFSAWGGTGDMDPVEVKKGDMYTLPECSFTAPALYVFDKWDLGAPGDQVKIEANTQIKALWKVIDTSNVSESDSSASASDDNTPPGGTAPATPASPESDPSVISYDTALPGGITPTAPVPLNSLQTAILGRKSDKDMSGSSFSLLQVKGTPKSKTAVRLRWKTVPGATGYIVYGNKCGKKNKYEKIKEVTGKTFTQKKLKKGTYYKYLVVAVDEDKVLAVSKTIHVATKGGKVGNNTRVKAGKSELSLKAGKTKKVKATLKAGSKKVKLHRKIAWESDNASIARVKNGKITAVKEGTCYVYAYAQNGIYARIKVSVK